MSQLPAFWLRDSLAGRVLAPLGWLTAAVARARYRKYRKGQGAIMRLPVPVVVIGNIFVGGTGKTPLVAWVVDWLVAQGKRPGILVRGYGGSAATWPQPVTAHSDPALVGDEGVLLARRTGRPVAAGPERAAAARLLLDAGCDVIVSDDGLQHFRLARDVEIVVLDAARGLGNGRCLPAGPLREPTSRLATVDLVLANGGPSPHTPYGFQLVPDGFVRLRDGRRAGADEFRSSPVDAVAGIGNPRRFFQALAEQGLDIVPHAFPDHHRYRAADLDFPGGRPIVCTEKDAVKIAAFADQRHWYQPVSAVPDEATRAALERVLRRVI